eukprot:scaffold58370_cov56-Phaeocystis_antarctica.AAC.6
MLSCLVLQEGGDAGGGRLVTPQASNPCPAQLAPARLSDGSRACDVSCCREAKMQGMRAP